MKTTLKEVALKAGVTPATVSLVLSGNKRISPETVKKVMNAVKLLQYSPNTAARALAGGRTGIISVMAVSFSSWYELTLLRGIEKGLEGKGYSLVQQPTGGGKEFEKKVIKEIINENKADALIVIGINKNPAEYKGFKAGKKILVTVGEKAEGFPCISFDDYSGAYQAVKEMIATGRRRIALITGRTSRDYISSDVIKRHEGYKQALRDSGIEYDKTLVAHANNYYFEEGVRQFGKLLDSGARFDALFCAAGDTCAIGVIKEARNRGIKIPKDIALIGYDDIEMAQAVLPELTTVRQPVYEAGKKAVEAVMYSLRSGTQAPDFVFPVELIRRASA